MNIKPQINLAIADDHVLFRQGLISILNNFEHFNVNIEVNNGRQLLEKLANSKIKIDICLFEVRMPEMNGYETLSILKKKWPEMKVLILSAYNNEFAVIKMLREGANGYLLKNCSAIELHQALNNIYNTGIYYTEMISGRLIHLLQNKNKDTMSILTDKEIQFLTLCPTPLTYIEIGKIMCVSPRTIDKFSRVLFEKLNVHSRTALAAFAFDIGLCANVSNNRYGR